MLKQKERRRRIKKSKIKLSQSTDKCSKIRGKRKKITNNVSMISGWRKDNLKKGKKE
tara:strand:- start:3813 stop:3983 length:171 start_codon:yes stop_codon:yes gene_type:complete